MTSSKTVNDVTFAPGKIYLATAFGYVVIDDTKFVVEESHFYTEALTSVAQAGDLLLISTASRLYYGDANEYHDQLSTFNATSSMANCRMRVIDEQSFFSLMSDKTSLAQMDLHDNGTVSFNTQNLYNSLTTDVQKTHGGYLLNVPGDSVCYKTNEAGLDLESIDTDGEVCSSHPSGDGTLASMWAGGPDGLHLLGSQNYYLPNAMTMPQPFWMTYNKERDMLYVSSSGTNAFFENNAYPIQVNTYDGMKWTDVTPEGAPNHRTRGSYWIEFMPGDPDTYLMGTWRNGLLKVKDNKVVTPPTEQVLPGVTRSKVIDVAGALGLELHQIPVAAESAGDYDAAFISGTSLEVLPVSEIGDLHFDVHNKVLREIISGYSACCGQ